MTVIDAAGVEIGELIDVVADTSADPPLVSAFFILHDDEQLAASWAQVAAVDIEHERLRLGVPLERVKPAALRGDELALVDAVLDKQVLDMRDRTFVRVQDVLLEMREGRLVVAGVDASSGAVMRRMGLGFLSRRMARKADDVVPWEEVNLIPLRLSRLNFVEAFAEVAEMHPADLADVISQVGPRERAAVLAALNAQLAADTLQEMEPEIRVAALIEMPVPRAIAVLAEIDPDEAADTLADLPDDLAQELLAGLPHREAESLRVLASHPEHSAGALMTTDFVTMPGSMTAAQALDRIRAEQPEDEALSIIFVVDEAGHLIGTISLGDLVLAALDRRLDDVMDDDPVSVGAAAEEEEVGRLMTHYNLLALPVVDDQGGLMGIVTLDDALEAVLPEEWKQRLPRLFR
jgi:CBS domain-containing protein/sporulation protein YlmC with PRC-barrel domain